MYSKVLLWFVAVTVILGIAGAGAVHKINNTPPPELSTMFDAKESFHFEVRYGFMRLGDVYVTARDTVMNGQKFLHGTAVIQSNSGIPIMGSRRYEYHSIMEHNDTTAFSHFFWIDNIHRDRPMDTAYDFDYEKGHVYSIRDGEIRDTLELLGPADGGPALFYVGRMHAGTDREIDYPIYIDDEKAYINIKNSLQTDNIRNDAFDNRNVDVYISNGFADINGPFGFSGRFESRYDTSELRIPVEARVSVWIGNVRVRLVEYMFEEE